MDIDFLGAIFPLVVSLVLTAILLSIRGFCWIRYLSGLTLAVGVSLIFSTAAQSAIVIKYQQIGLYIALSGCMLSLYKRPFRSLFSPERIHEFSFSRKNVIDSVLISYSFGSLSALMTDIVWLLIAPFPMYIGGMGLEDGIFLLGLFSALEATLIASLMKFLVSAYISRK